MSLNLNLYIYNKKNIWDLNGLWLPIGKYIFILNKQVENISTGILISNELHAEYNFLTEDLMVMISNQMKENYQFDKNIIKNITDNYGIHGESDTESLDETNSIINDDNNNNEENIDTILINNFLNSTIPKECAICLMDIEEEDIETLICSHYFHKNCIMRWVHQNNSCPICRHRIIEEEELEQQTQEQELTYNENVILNHNTRLERRLQRRRQEYNNFYASNNIESVIFYQ